MPNFNMDTQDFNMDTRGQPPGDDYVETVDIDPSKLTPVPDGSTAPSTNNTVQVNGYTQGVLNDILAERNIHGGDPMGPDDPSAGPADGEFDPAADPNAPLILTTETAHKPSAMSELIASMMDKPELNRANGGMEGVSDAAKLKDFDEKKHAEKKDADKAASNEAKDANKAANTLKDFDKSGKSTENSKGFLETVADGIKAGAKKVLDYVNNYSDPDANTGLFGSSLPFPDGKVGNSHSIPAGLGLDLGLINSLMGGNVTFSASGLEKLGLGGKDVDGFSGDLDAVFAQLGEKGLDALGKNGRFDLDDFGSYFKPDGDFTLDIDGNGKQDMVEYVIDMALSVADQAAFIEHLQNNNLLVHEHII